MDLVRWVVSSELFLGQRQRTPSAGGKHPSSGSLCLSHTQELLSCAYLGLTRPPVRFMKQVSRSPVAVPQVRSLVLRDE